MANAYTGTTAFANLVQPAYDRLVEFSLRAQPLHREVADKKPAQQAMPGSSVTFELYQDLATATSTLTETVDPDAVALGNPTTVSVTLAEYGNAVLRTRLLNLFSFSDVDPAIANIVAYNMVDSLDAVVLNVLIGGTNVIREISGTMTINGGTTATVTGTDVLKSRDIFAATANLRNNKAIPRKGPLYWAAVSPLVAYDLKQEGGTGAVGWLAPHAYSAPGSIWASEIGSYGGAFFVETPRAYNATDGATGTRVFRTLVAGQQALAEAVAEEPHVVVGPVVDKLMRARPIGWYGVLGWALYRQPALFRIETTSSIKNT